jgi:hypothetical protein
MYDNTYTEIFCQRKKHPRNRFKKMQPATVAGPFQLFVLQQTSSTIFGLTFFLERAPVLLRIDLASGEPFIFFLY